MSDTYNWIAPSRAAADAAFGIGAENPVGEIVISLSDEEAARINIQDESLRDLRMALILEKKAPFPSGAKVEVIEGSGFTVAGSLGKGPEIPLSRTTVQAGEWRVEERLVWTGGEPLDEDGILPTHWVLSLVIETWPVGDRDE